MSTTIDGVIRGKTIELSVVPGLDDGRAVRVIVTPLTEGKRQLHAILRTAGSMAKDGEFNAVMAVVERLRRGPYA